MLRRPLRASLCAPLLLGVVSCSRPAPQPTIETASGFAQGTTYAVQWWSPTAVDRTALETALTAELDAIDELLSNYRPDSVIERFNAVHSTAPTTVPPELVRLLRLAGDVHRGSAGCFDPTVRPLVRLWGFDGDAPQVPAAADIAAVRDRVGLDKLAIVDDTTVQRSVPDLEIDMSSIGQGYTVARLAAVVERFGIANYLVEIGGELMSRGVKPGGIPWRIGIENATAEGGVAEPLTMPTDRAMAVITSGTYRHFFEAEQQSFSHILDPRTAAPVDHALVAVTVVGPEPARAAAWATALLCLGPDEAVAAADREGIAAVLTVRGENDLARVHTARFTADWLTASP